MITGGANTVLQGRYGSFYGTYRSDLVETSWLAEPVLTLMFGAHDQSQGYDLQLSLTAVWNKNTALLINHVHTFIGGHRGEHVDEELLVQWGVFQSRKCVEKHFVDSLKTQPWSGPYLYNAKENCVTRYNDINKKKKATTTYRLPRVCAPSLSPCLLSVPFIFLCMTYVV